MIVYYFSDFEAVTEQTIESMHQWMPQQQRDILAGLKNIARKREQAFSYAMLAYAIGNNMAEINSGNTTISQFKIQNTKFKIENPLPLWRLGEHGKPYLTTHEGILFNISHCREAIVTAVSDHEIGVDAEGRRKFSETLLQRALNDEEQASVLAAPDPELEFARIWTRKEAWFKYTGTGILPDHLKTTEAEAKEAGCSIETIWTDDRFWLSSCQKL